MTQNKAYFIKQIIELQGHEANRADLESMRVLGLLNLIKELKQKKKENPETIEWTAHKVFMF